MGDITSRFSPAVLLQGVALFVLIAGGIVTGLYIADKLGITGSVMASSLTAGDLQNKSRFAVGERLPDLQLTDRIDQPVSMDKLLHGQKTLLAFVSNGCGACEQFTARFERPNALPDDSYQVVLVSSAPEYFFENSPLPSYRVPQSVLDEYEVFGMPTLVGIDDEGTMKFVSTGYAPAMDGSFLESAL
ncbi:thioredoxin family protein [bacterium]|nr:thioredoxin family protein [bacterium]